MMSAFKCQFNFEFNEGNNLCTMFRNLLTVATLLITILCLTECCLITNCPRGGKRSHFHRDVNVKPCISCGPGRSGQCFGPNICCGPFGCLVGTSEAIRCQREGFFQEPEPCIAGNGYCRKNTGRCASDGICCTQDSCFVDKSCSIEEKLRPQDIQLESLYNILPFPNMEYGNDLNNA